MKRSPEELLALLAELIRTAPTFPSEVSPSDDDARWLGMALAVLQTSGNLVAAADFRSARENVGSWSFSRTKMMTALQDAYFLLELQAPISSQGAFIPPGEAFNGYAALVRIVKSASKDLLLVDPYVNATLFTEIAPIIPEGVSLRCLTSKQNSGELIAASGKWKSTGEHVTRPVTVRIAPPKTLHDRHIIVDGQAVWNISQSIKDIAGRSPASVTQDRTDMASNKVEFWETSWCGGEPLPTT